ncbi:MAG: hypothetical protein COW48_09820 [Hydrogenophilales bacterium CG17_big_fil_post_rev_8_21_14_2_50_63_12]|nr:MAG: hypothetical protein COW48_09820 [Hydrogenophilales bacterium CG17_big_fil_post_rev_8_21_14_2_50_63_12]PIX96697.1 MAG: hypothetical protein COZ24_09230 [Hydrogenophilales bacterium CG_4_10_14_3_um_filter_63_21]
MRLLLAHKQKTSARVRFLRFPHGLCAFQALPALSSVLEDSPANRVETYPNLYLRSAEAQLGLTAGSLALEAEFSAGVVTPDGPIRVRLATFTSIEPPFDAAANLGGRFVAITEARGCAPAELELLRQAYTVLMG